MSVDLSASAEPKKDEPLHKYDTKEFLDPIVRCDGCAKLVHRAFIAHAASCNHCGNRRFQNVRGITTEEHAGMAEGSYDFGMDHYVIAGDFLAIFERVGEVSA